MEKVQSYIDANKERFLDELFDLLRIPSISAQSEHKPDMVRCAEWLAAALVKAGADRAEVMPTDGNPVVYAEKIIDPAAKTVLVYGHYDVMPVDPRAEWRTEHFEPVIKDGRIWGRGADDDKGQLFMLDLSYFGWSLLSTLPSIFYSFPFYQDSFAAASGYMANTISFVSPETFSVTALPVVAWTLIIGLWNLVVSLFYYPNYMCVELGYFETAKRTSGTTSSRTWQTGPDNMGGF